MSTATKSYILLLVQFFLNSQKRIRGSIKPCNEWFKKKAGFFLCGKNVAFINSEIKPLGCTPLLRKKDSLKVQMEGRKSINQQLETKGGPSEVALLTNFGDLINSFIMDLKFDCLYRSWSFRTTRLVIDHTTIPLAEYSLSHLAALEETLAYNLLLIDICEQVREGLQKKERTIYTTLSDEIFTETSGFSPVKNIVRIIKRLF
ncbi:17994_t:CDS:2 [Funneliformis geosporum]|uniref:17994_t:CDS:1 n=1 Tax=Funneliformis geosporum TaxID=1117311 RepID=A0A9W4T1E7_9GLOM|nr:17994_t:CDS:2 [Funneliformis geosporum]